MSVATGSRWCGLFHCALAGVCLRLAGQLTLGSHGFEHRKSSICAVELFVFVLFLFFCAFEARKVTRLKLCIIK